MDSKPALKTRLSRHPALITRRALEGLRHLVPHPYSANLMRTPLARRCTGHLITEKDLPGDVEPPGGQALVRISHEGSAQHQR